jgi:peptidoglycan/LPS O-acetylase OafA/YrhL
VPQFSTPPPRPGPAHGRLGGLDSVRLICASVVLLDHLGTVPWLAGINRENRLGHALAAAYGNALSGPAAVIVFFVISGFCIHYPYRGNQPIPFASYYARRYVRILLPMLAAILLGKALRVDLPLLNDSILWSLLAEEIYYLLYPLIRRARDLVGLRPVIAAAYVAAVLVVLKDPHAGNYPSYGAAFNWILGLPCWLLGCELAELVDAPRETPSRLSIWLWRGGVWFAAATCSVLRFHSPLKYPWTLNLFALVAMLWLLREITYRKTFPAPAWLERGGTYSYSIYLVHLQGAALFGLWGQPFGSPMLKWSLTLGFTLLFCYAFARLIELPAHALARSLGARLLRSGHKPATAAQASDSRVI